MKFFILTILVIMLSFTAGAKASEIKLAFFNDYYSENMILEEGVRAPSIKIVTEVFKRMKVSVSVKILPWRRALLYLKHGKIDGVFTIIKNDQWETFADYSNEVLMKRYVSLFVRKNSSLSYNGDLGKLKKYTFGVMKNFCYGAKFDQALKNKVISKTLKFSEVHMMIRPLVKEKIDIIIGDKYKVPFIDDHLTNKSLSGSIKRLSPDFCQNPQYLAFSKKRDLKDIRIRFDKILKEMKVDGSYKKIIAEFGNGWSQVACYSQNLPESNLKKSFRVIY